MNTERGKSKKLMKSEKKQRIRNVIDQSLIRCMIINPSLYPTLSQYLTNPLPEFQTKYFKQTYNEYDSLLIQMNPLLLDDITEEEKEINSIIQEDKIEQFKSKIAKNLLDPNHKDRKGISLIEKCAFFDSTQCLNYLIEENVSIERHSINYFYKIGLMEYGALKGNRDVIKICLEKGQKIQKETLILGLIAHQNELVEWMIEEGNFDETIKSQILGIADNIEFNEKLLKSGIDINAKDNDGETALMHASQEGHIEIVRELIERGADINVNIYK